VKAAYLAPYDTPAHRVAVLKFVQTIPLKASDPGFDIVSDTAASLTMFRDLPVLLLWGMKDFVFDHHFLDEWKRHFPRAEVYTWPDCGHYLLEDAGELAIMRVWEFLQRYPLTEAP
jgi:haloalkane dehalogenase